MLADVLDLTPNRRLVEFHFDPRQQTVLSQLEVTKSQQQISTKPSLTKITLLQLTFIHPTSLSQTSNIKYPNPT